MKHRHLILLIVTLTLLVLLMGCTNKTAIEVTTNSTGEENETKENEPKDSKGEETFKANDMEFLVSYGLNGYVKYGEYFRVHAKITNHGENYDGLFQVILPDQENDNVLYQQEVNVNTKETKDVEFLVPMNGIGEQFHYRFADNKNKTIVEKTAIVKILDDENITFFGILSKEHSGYKYLEGGKTKLYYLSKDNIPGDYLGLDALDAIIIHDYDMRVLTKTQYNSLIQWVRNGGSLILRNESNAKLFQESLKNHKGTKRNFFTQYNIEFGNILIANIDLKFSAEQSQEMGTDVLDEIIQNLGEMKQVNYANRYGGIYYNYRIYDVLRIPDANEIPEIGGYIIVLLIYILLVGPILYILLRKKDKRNLTWVLVPVIAILFTMIVYGLGLNTRITQPYSKYLTYAKIGEDGKVIEDTYFSLTSPYNKEYSASLDGEYPIGMITNQNGYMSDSELINRDYSDYTRAVIQEDTDITLRMRDFSSFTPLYFTGKRETTGQGSYEYNIKDNIDQITGNFTNNLGYDLNNTAVICNGTIIPIGDIKDGETVKIDNAKGSSYSTPNSIYYTDVIDKIAGGNLNSKDTDVLRRHKALEIYIEDSMINMTMDNYLIGFSKEKETFGLMNSLDIQSQGIKVNIIPLDISNINKDGEEIIPCIDCYITDTDGYTLDMYRYMPNDVIDVKYTFDKNDKIKSIQYSKRGNLEFNPKSEVGFFGTIYFYNYKKKDFELVFESGKAGTITDLTPYLDEENNLLVKYMAESNNSNKAPDMIPVLTAKKEAY